MGSALLEGPWGLESPKGLVVLADVVANVQVQHLAVRQTDDFVAILGFRGLGVSGFRVKGLVDLGFRGLGFRV